MEVRLLVEREPFAFGDAVFPGLEALHELSLSPLGFDFVDLCCETAGWIGSSMGSVYLDQIGRTGLS